MKTRSNKLTALVLTLAMLLSLIPSFTFSVSAASEYSYNSYKNMLEAIKPENNYGMSDIPGKLIFHAWGWSYQNISENLEKIAEQGFSTILVSPPNEIKMPTKGVKFQEPEIDGISPNGWWMLYQPAGFQLNESTDNALGTKSDFVKLCEDAHKLGFKIMVEAVVGYMGTDDDHVGEYDNVSENPMDHVNPRAWEFEPELISAKAFHSPWVNSEFKSYEGGFGDREIEESLTQHAIDGKPDLATETQLVQDTMYDYFVELVEAGVDGFYFNDATYIETATDTFFSSDFWNDTFVKLKENYPDKNLQAIAEITDGPGDGRSTEEYLQVGMNLTNTTMSDAIRESVINGKDFTDAFNEEFPQNNSVLWSENYETYANGETSGLTSDQIAKLWALSASRKGVKGIYLARPSETPAKGKDEVNNILSGVTLGEVNVPDLGTEAVKRVNHFASFFKDEYENVHYDNGFAVIERGMCGAVLVNIKGKSTNVSLKRNTLSDGHYTDAITGNEFTVKDGKIEGEIGNSGIAVLYYADETEPIFRIGELDVDVMPLDLPESGKFTLKVSGNSIGAEGIEYYYRVSPVAPSGAPEQYEPQWTELTLTQADEPDEAGAYTAILSNISGTMYIEVIVTTEDPGTGRHIVIAWGCGATDYPLWVGDQQFTPTNPTIFDDNGGTATYDPNMNTLTLYNYNYTGDGHNNAAIYYGGTDTLNLMLVGENSVTHSDNTAVESYGVYAIGDIIISGGTIMAQGGTAAFNKAPTIDDTFTDALIFCGENESEANDAGAKDESELATNYNQKYVCVRDPVYTITFEPNGGSVDTASMTTVDDKLESLPSATRSGYRFKGWYDAEEGGNEITLDTVFTQDTTVYAQWILEKEFVDVHSVNHWATADINYVYSNGLMRGVSETHFAPNDSLTRAMLVTVLYRLEGEPATNGSNPFVDVDMDAYYANAVIWAKQVGIVNGISETMFAPNNNSTREQIATIMYRYAQYKGYDVSVGENTNFQSYDDFDSVSEYAIASMRYAIDSGLIKGRSATTLNPLDNATRAEIAAILHRFIQANK